MSDPTDARTCACPNYTCAPSCRLEGFVVDIDRASFGHEVVEIETMSGPEEVDIVSARDSINALARSLGAQRNGESGRPIKVRFPVKKHDEHWSISQRPA